MVPREAIGFSGILVELKIDTYYESFIGMQ
jgi:hypothetical protein